MAEETQLLEQEQQLAELNKLIAASHKNANDDAVQQEALEKSLQYLQRYSEGHHLFCDKLMRNVAIHSLILFSFGDNEPLTWLKYELARCLDTCSKCSFSFHAGRATLKQTFITQRGVDIASVEHFSTMILTWEADRLLQRLQDYDVAFASAKSTNPGANVPIQLLLGIAECLCGPGMLRLNADLRKLFDSILSSLLASGHSFVKTSRVLTPGLIFLLFEGTEEQRTWALKQVSALQKPELLKEPQVHSDILEEYQVHFLNIQNPDTFTSNGCRLFYRNMCLLMKLYETDTIVNKFALPIDSESLTTVTNFEIQSLFKVTLKHIMGYLNEPFPYILRFFKFLLVRIGDGYWAKVAPYTFQNVLDTVTGSPYFLQNLVMLPTIVTSSNDPDSEANVMDLIDWIDPFLSTLDASKQQTTINKLSLIFITLVESQNSISLQTKAMLFKKACYLISTGLTIPSKLYSPTFKNDLLLRSDSKLVVSTKLVRFMDYGTSRAIFYPQNEREFNGEVSKLAVGVLAKALRFDVLNLAQSTYDIHNGNPASTLKFSADMFRLILKQNFPAQLELAYQLLVSLDNVSSIIPLKGSQQLEAAEFLEFVQQFFVRLSDIDSKEIKMILSDFKSLRGYWACVLSSSSNVYQSAVDVLYETFDADGRLEGIYALLDNNLNACLTAINETLTNLVFFKAYEPCPRAVKVLTDVMAALNSPINGIFGKSAMFTEDVKKTLRIFWNRCWAFLDLIYVQTLSWADKYTDLVEFTRDTLDLSHAVLKSFHKINEFYEGNDATNQAFVVITNTFPNMLVWLRLSDPGLLSSCVNLISSTVDLATEFGLNFDSNVISLLAKYGSRARKFNNKLTDQQSEEILMRAKIFDKTLVENIFQEAESYRRSKLPSNSLQPSSSESSPAPRASPSTGRTGYDDEIEVTSARVVPSKLHQLKIDKFGSLSRVPPRIPSKSKLPLTAIEKARAEIKGARVIHPPTQPGFNIRKKPTKKPEDSSDDDDDDNDDDDIHGLFGLKKPKPKQGITILSQGFNKLKRLNISDQQREEENSRKRLNVDLRPLYSKILQWSFKNDDEFPDSSYQDLRPVADQFNSSAQYIQTYEPLLLLECWQAILSAKTRESNKPMYIHVGSKSTVGDFFEVYFSLTKTEIQEQGYTDSDLIVLAVNESQVSPAHLVTPKIRDVKQSRVSCLGKIHEIKNVKGDRVDVTVRVTRSNHLNSWLTPESLVMMMRVIQMTTIEREYSSLFGLEYYSLAEQIFEARPDTGSTCNDDEVAHIQKTYKVNESQAKAIGVSFNTSGFTLIQGPPGTGKTKTIVGIIGYMLSSFRASNAISLPGTSEKTDFSSVKKRKVLVCAPSNAAVDELVLRLKDGVVNSKGEHYTPKLVRLGRTDAINSAVKDMTLEELVDAKLGKNPEIVNNMDAYNKELKAIQKQIEECKAKLRDENNPPGPEVAKLKRELTQKSNVIKMKKDQERESISSHYRNRDINRRKLQAEILNGAEIICATLSGSAHDMVANMGIMFDSVIIDEACQCTELSAVIPLRYGCNRCIMVGDPNQLPPTVLSGVAANSGYDQSLFVRMAKRAPPLLLNVQYRMNSAISKFPSKQFYEGALQDGPQNDELTARPWHKDPLLPPYSFFDIVEGRQSQNVKTMSYTNNMEVEIAIELIEKLFRCQRSYNFKNNIGIITPYKEQNSLLKSSFQRRFGRSIVNEISFNTIDGFQGQEKEVIIMSCVRADPSKGGIGFLKDFRRMNVALTRPKCSLWILGNHDSLVKNKLWSDLLTDAKERGLLKEARSGFTDTGFKPVGKAHDIPKRSFDSVNTDQKQHKTKTQRPNNRQNHQNQKNRRDPPATNVSDAGSNENGSSSMPSRSGSLPPKPTAGITAVPQEFPSRSADAHLSNGTSKVSSEPKPTVSGNLPSVSSRGSLRSIPTGPLTASSSSTSSSNTAILPNGPSNSVNPLRGPSSKSEIPGVPRSDSSKTFPEGPSATRTGNLPPRPNGPSGSEGNGLPTGPRMQKKKRPKQDSMFIHRKKKR